MVNRAHLKKMKSRWLWKVATCRPLKALSWLNNVASRRPTRWPTTVSKWFKITSGLWCVARACPCHGHITTTTYASASWIGPDVRAATALPHLTTGVSSSCQGSERGMEQHTLISLDSFRLESLKCAVGPRGKCTSKSPFTSFLFSFKTMRLVKPRLLAYSAIFFTE